MSPTHATAKQLQNEPLGIYIDALRADPLTLPRARQRLMQACRKQTPGKSGRPPPRKQRPVPAARATNSNQFERRDGFLAAFQQRLSTWRAEAAESPSDAGSSADSRHEVGLARGGLGRRPRVVIRRNDDVRVPSGNCVKCCMTLLASPTRLCAGSEVVNVSQLHMKYSSGDSGAWCTRPGASEAPQGFLGGASTNVLYAATCRARDLWHRWLATCGDNMRLAKRGGTVSNRRVW